MTPALPEFMYLGTEGLFFILLLAYTVHGVFLAYHWFTYGSSKNFPLIALTAYLVGGAILFLTLAISLQLL